MHWHALASIRLEVKVPTDEKANGGGQPSEDGPDADVSVPVSGQVSASTREVGGRWQETKLLHAE